MMGLPRAPPAEEVWLMRVGAYVPLLALVVVRP